MNKKDKAIEELKNLHKILTIHGDAFSTPDAFEIATALRYLLAYIENDGK